LQRASKKLKRILRRNCTRKRRREIPPVREPGGLTPRKNRYLSKGGEDEDPRGIKKLGKSRKDGRPSSRSQLSPAILNGRGGQKMPHPWEMFEKMMRDRGWADKSRDLDPQSKDSFYLQGYFGGSCELTVQYLRGELKRTKEKKWWEQ